MSATSPQAEEQQGEEGRKRRSQDQNKDELPQAEPDEPNIPEAFSLAPAILVEDNVPQIGRRSRRHTSVSISKGADGDFPSLSSAHGSLSSCMQCSIRTHGNVPDGLDRAVTMVQTYPLMLVDGTAFENQIARRGTGENMEGSRRPSTNLITNLEEGAEASTTDLVTTIGRLRSGSSVVSLASRLKRACMWQVIIANALAYRSWNDSFRFERLRSVLEALLLPVILRKRGEKDTSHRFVRRPRCDGPALLGDDEGQKPQGSVLWERSKFFQSLGSPKFCEEMSSFIYRYRYASGDAIVTPGTPSQDALYILISGKCDAILRSSDTTTFVQRSRLEVGECFGGLFSGRDVFTKLYRSISQCIVWMIKREDFETLFSKSADARMKEVYVNALKEHNMERLLQHYPMPECLSRVPIYRRIDRVIENYAKDFTPLVLTKNDVLFEEGDPPGDVYCLLEGQVRRAQRGADMTYETGTKQILSPNECDNNFSLSTRFVLLGEEPHILPGPLRYKCTVFSRAALFFKIKRGRFVDALLDDAKLYLQIREKLTTQIRLSMRLSADALLTLPLVRDMPLTNLNTIVNAAEPRVVERCVSICEPAQPIREIYLVVAGDVRDPRQFNRAPTLPISSPLTEDEEAALEERGRELTASPKGKKDKNVNKTNAAVAGGREREKKHSNTPLANDVSISGRNNYMAMDLGDNTDGMNHMRYRWSFFQNGGVGCGGGSSKHTNNVTCPDEQQDLAPSLPPNPAKSFLCTLGGGWEGLLLEKWPNGWETTTTVELWAIPTLTIRTEFNSLPKSMQNPILHLARTTQMNALGLPSIVVAKLPPMSVFLPPEKRLTKHSLGVEKGQRQEKNSPAHSRKYAGSAHSYERSTGPGSRYERGNGELSESHESLISESSTYLSPNNLSVSKKRTPTRQTPQNQQLTPRSPALSPSPPKKEKKVTKVTKPIEMAVNVNSEVAELPNPKAGPPPLLFLRKLASKPVEPPPVITPEMCSLYVGQKPQKGIVRQPKNVVKGPEGAGKSEARYANLQPPHWPQVAGSKKQWFQVVPSYAPLPGTVNNQNYITTAPILVPNTALMVKRGKGHGEVLASQAKYFACLAENQRIHAMGLEAQNVHSVESPNFASNSVQSVSSAMMSRPLPGRYAFRL